MSDHYARLDYAATAAKVSSETGFGGPFGALVVRENKDGTIQTAIGYNQVLSTHDPTAHAEVQAIRKAAKTFGTHDLSDCIMYATSAPCPMCRAAIMWANIKTVYYGNTADETAEVGFRDADMYEYFENGCNDESVLKVIHVEGHSSCKDLLDRYKELNKELY